MIVLQHPRGGHAGDAGTDDPDAHGAGSSCGRRLVDEHATEEGVEESALGIDARLGERREEATAPIAEVRRA